MLRLINVSKAFSTKDKVINAVQSVTLEVDSGEIYGLIGYSGAGKSTLIRLINLLERPSEGQVFVDGIELTALKEKQLRKTRKQIGMIFQHFNLMKSCTVFENVAFALKGSGISKNDLENRVNHLLSLVELGDKSAAYPSQLSGGQKQRVAIARALANEPKILLCDEATSALDPQTTASILKLLKQLNKELGLTIVLITHEMSVIKEIADRVGIMEDGRIKESGRVIDIFSNPKEAITQQFIKTTTHINKIYELIEEKSKITHLNRGEKMVLLAYNTLNTQDALISQISRDYQVNANVIFGHIEVIQDEPLGRLVIILSGEANKIEQAIEKMIECHVKVEVIKAC